MKHNISTKVFRLMDSIETLASTVDEQQRASNGQFGSGGGSGGGSESSKPKRYLMSHVKIASDPKVGEKVAVMYRSGHWESAPLQQYGEEATVKKITPKGTVVLSNGHTFNSKGHGERKNPALVIVKPESLKGDHIKE